ncbi:MAG: Unknown protein [uncultured Sulfurovum sp.]|uniref:DUF2059 domain-containing protein n=1 Tax=uncultured Sulfurovum sp. TaxID=269237 RepID=A0A6S6TD94_9BACT|nr:MAG: Unknown protein [uncultured Sulfurovum sp.]
MKKILVLFILTLQTLFSATSKEILDYLSLSHSEEEVLGIEQVFNSMRQSQENNESNASTTQVSIVYQEYLEEHISSHEINKLLALYRTPIMNRYVAEVENFNITQDDMNAFLASLKEEPLLSEREEIVNHIVQVLVNEALQLNFYRSMMQRYTDKNSSSQSNNEKNETKMTTKEKGYINAMKISSKNKLLYGSQVFSLEEMNELKDAIDSSIFKKIKRVENEALVQIMNDFIRGIVSEPKRPKEKKNK